MTHDESKYVLRIAFSSKFLVEILRLSFWTKVLDFSQIYHYGFARIVMPLQSNLMFGGKTNGTGHALQGTNII